MKKEWARKIAIEGRIAEKKYQLHGILLCKIVAKRQGDYSLCWVRREDISTVITECLEPIVLTENTNVFSYDMSEIETQVCNLITKRFKHNRRSKPERKKREVKKEGDLEASAGSKCLSAQEEVPSKDINPWNLIETFQVIEAEDTIAIGKAKAAQKQKDMASNLNVQIQLKTEAKRLEKENDEKILSIQANAIKQWKEEQKHREDVEKEKILYLRKVRQEQIEESSRRKKKESAESRANELQEIERLKETLREEEKEKREKKEQERIKWDRIKAENALDVHERELRKQEEMKTDAKLMSDLKERLDKKEAKRIAAFEGRAAKMEMNVVALSGADAKKKEGKRQFEMKLLHQTKERIKAEVLMEKEKEKHRKEMKELIIETNKQLAEDRKCREQELEKEEEAYAKQCLKEKESLLAEEEEKKLKENRTKLQYQAFLWTQIEEKEKQNAASDEMTSVERSMNKKLMRKIEVPIVKKKIVDKLVKTESKSTDQDLLNQQT